ncbi:hypothetical protein IF1G_08745 [Cordyceps javanica]|uniref:Uncharacterized protein n=1 Tax=Cordyceps javanica TaxID=43265 RepID=A0A545UTM6_9HYPO|nr:hypothetical protein IF1G_08745 [Cordyceps javanica]
MHAPSWIPCHLTLPRMTATPSTGSESRCWQGTLLHPYPSQGMWQRCEADATIKQ